MLTRRNALAILGTVGIGTAVFQRALAAAAADGPVTREMVANAEWVSGIKLTDAQRETAVNVLSGRRDSNPRHPAWEASALPTELRPLRLSLPPSLVSRQLS